MQIILNFAKCSKRSSRVSSKLPTCIWRRNNNRQREPPWKRCAASCAVMLNEENPRNDQNVCLHPEKSKPEGHCSEAENDAARLVGGRLWMDTEGFPLSKGSPAWSFGCKGGEGFPTFLPSPRFRIK